MISTPDRHPGGSGDALGDYLRRIGQIPVLTRSEEAALGQRIGNGRAAAQRLTDTGTTHPASEIAELRGAVADGEAATEHFVLANLRLVVSVARRHQTAGIALLDLIQEGNIGLLRAVQRFDHRKGFRFSTYATWWIRRSLSVAKAGAGLGRLPDHASDDLARIPQTVATLHQQLQRVPTDQETADQLGIPLLRFRQLLNYTRVPRSLSDAVIDGADLQLGDVIEDTDEQTPENQAIAAVVPSEITANLSVLDDRERKILALRYGLNHGEPHTLSEIAQALNLSSERIRQVEARALCKLRHPSARLDRLRGLLAG